MSEQIPTPPPMVEAEAEIERLRVALRRILRLSDDYCPRPGDYCWEVGCMGQIAEDALQCAD